MSNPLLIDACIPKRYMTGRPLVREGPWEATTKRVVGRLGTGFTIALIGKSGTGKSQIGAVVAYHACEKQMRARYCEAMEFFLAIKATYGDRGESTEEAVIAEFMIPKLLVIDEFDKRAETTWEDGLLFYLINKRYNAVKDTLLIGNLSHTAFCQAIGPAIVSRMNETGGVISCDWASFR